VSKLIITTMMTWTPSPTWVSGTRPKEGHDGAALEWNATLLELLGSTAFD
jgi:hypothetical protein